MNRLIKIETTKILSYSTFWVLTVIAGVFYVLILYAAGQIQFDMQGVDLLVYFRFPTVWQTISYYSSWYNLLLALLVIILTANDFAFRTFRQHIIDGLSLQEIFSAKLMLWVLFAGITTAVNFVIALMVGRIYSGSFQYFLQDFYYVFLYFINVLGIMAVAFFVAVWLRKTAGAIVVFIGLYIFEGIFRGYLALMGASYGRFLPFKVFSQLCERPSLQKMITDPMIKQSVEQSFTFSSSSDFSAALNASIAVGYIFLFFYGAYYLLQKKDL